MCQTTAHEISRIRRAGPELGPRHADLVPAGIHVPLDRYAASYESSVLVVPVAIAVPGARSAPSRHCQPAKGEVQSPWDIKGSSLAGSERRTDGSEIRKHTLRDECRCFNGAVRNGHRVPSPEIDGPHDDLVELHLRLITDELSKL